MKISAKVLLWIGSITIFLSVVLQIIALIISSFSLALVGLIINAISVPLTIWQGYRSATEEQRRFEQERQEREQADLETRDPFLPILEAQRRATQQEREARARAAQEQE